MPAESFVEIWKFVARPNLCEPPACVKPPPRYRSCYKTTRQQKKSKTIDKMPTLRKIKRAATQRTSRQNLQHILFCPTTPNKWTVDNLTTF